MDKVYKSAAGVVLEKELLLHEAVITNDNEIVRKILSDTEGLNVDCRNNYGRTPIHLAASRGNTDILDMLIKANCDIETSDKFGMRPLHMAASYGHREAVDLLLKAGASISAVDKKQRTLLMMASHSSGGASFLEYILGKFEPRVEIKARDCEGASALHHAAKAGHPDAIDVLARIIPDLDLDAVDQRRQTALHYACAGGHQEVAGRLLDFGASLDLRDSEGCTALHLAARNRESRLFSWLLGRCSASELATLLRLADHRGFILLHVAASLGCTLILRSLLELEERRLEALEARCHEGNTPLHLAALNNQPQVADVLIEYGASLHSLNLAMLTPLELARKMGHSHVCRLLAEASTAASAGAETGAAGESSENEQEVEAQEKQALHIAAKSSLASIANMIARTARLDYPALLLQGTRTLFNSPDK